MSATDEAAQIATGWANTIVEESTKVAKELLKLLILKALESRKGDRAKIGAKNTIKKLLSGNHQLNAPVLVDRQDVYKIHQLAKAYHLPLAVVDGKEGTRIFFRDVDLGRVSEMMKEVMNSKLSKENMKQIVVSKEDASFFKTRAKKLDVPVTYLKSGDQVKIAFKQDDLEKVQAIIQDIKEERKLIPKRRIQFDRLKDQIGSLAKGTPILRVYDADLGKSLRFALPVTWKSFVKTVRGEFGYSYKEAADLASRVKSGAEKNMSIVGLKGEFKWKADIRNVTQTIERLETDIKHAQDSAVIKDFSFSELQLADEKKTRMLTIMHKETGHSYSTTVTTMDELKKQLMEEFSIDENTANELTQKANKMGYVKDGQALSQKQQVEIRKSRNAKTATVIMGNKNVKVALNDKEKAVLSLQQTFSLDRQRAASLYRHVEKIGVKEAVKSAHKKALNQIVEIGKKLSISRGAR